MNIIERVETPMVWFNVIVIFEKLNGKLRICLDPRPLNQAFKRHHYQLPTAEEFFWNMQGQNCSPSSKIHTAISRY